jgi:hypothetical protein
VTSFQSANIDDILLAASTSRQKRKARPLRAPTVERKMTLVSELPPGESNSELPVSKTDIVYPDEIPPSLTKRKRSKKTKRNGPSLDPSSALGTHSSHPDGFSLAHNTPADSNSHWSMFPPPPHSGPFPGPSSHSTALAIPNNSYLASYPPPAGILPSPYTLHTGTAPGPSTLPGGPAPSISTAPNPDADDEWVSDADSQNSQSEGEEDIEPDVPDVNTKHKPPAAKRIEKDRYDCHGIPLKATTVQQQCPLDKSKGNAKWVRDVERASLFAGYTSYLAHDRRQDATVHLLANFFLDFPERQAPFNYETDNLVAQYRVMEPLQRDHFLFWIGV